MLSIEQLLYNKKHTMSVHHVFDEESPSKRKEVLINNIEMFSEDALTSITKWISCLDYKNVNSHIK